MSAVCSKLSILLRVKSKFFWGPMGPMGSIYQDSVTFSPCLLYFICLHLQFSFCSLHASNTCLPQALCSVCTVLFQKYMCLSPSSLSVVISSKPSLNYKLFFHLMFSLFLFYFVFLALIIIL